MMLITRRIAALGIATLLWSSPSHAVQTDRLVKSSIGLSEGGFVVAAIDSYKQTTGTNPPKPARTNVPPPAPPKHR